MDMHSARMLGASQDSKGKRSTALGFLAALMVAGLMLVGASSPAHALTTFTVNSTGDGNDLDFRGGAFDGSSDGKCDVNSDASGDQCTLRAAIQQANFTVGQSTINFNIPDDPNVPGNEVKTIAPASPLPTIDQSDMFIDGYSPPGATENTRLVGTDANLLIELDGSNAGQDSSANGLTIDRSSNVTVRGLVINDFSGNGIEIRDSTGVKIEGNFIGTDPSGTQDRGNDQDGVNIRSVLLSGASNNVIGGAPRTAHNLISGNGSSGITILFSPENKVLGNLIGTSKDSKSALGNGSRGVVIASGDNNTVGDTVFGMANTIAFNGDEGVLISGSGTSGTSVLSNSIFSNAGLGINLIGLDGPDPNDARDADTGANNLQNKPVISSARISSSGTTIKGQLNSTPIQSFTIQLFANPRGENEGKKFLGEKVVTTGSDGKVSFTFKKVARGVITATATNEATGDTSEFSAPRRLVIQ